MITAVVVICVYSDDDNDDDDTVKLDKRKCLQTLGHRSLGKGWHSHACIV